MQNAQHAPNLFFYFFLNKFAVLRLVGGALFKVYVYYHYICMDIQHLSKFAVPGLLQEFMISDDIHKNQMIIKSNIL